MRTKLLTLCLIGCILFGLCALTKAQDIPQFEVTFTFNQGGLLWVNGTVVTNNTVTTFPNGSTLILAATPTNANYSYAYMLINGSQSFDNPVFFNVTSEFENSTFAVSALFVAEAIPTPSPSPSPSPVPELTVEDAGGLAFLALVCSIALPVVYLGTRKKNGE